MKAALAICEQHYIEAGKRNGCNRCPIYQECTARHQWSQAGLDEWRERLSRAALPQGR